MYDIYKKNLIEVRKTVILLEKNLVGDLIKNSLSSFIDADSSRIELITITIYL